jgi:hypothetical protein
MKYPSNFNGPSLTVDNITTSRELKDTTGANSSTGYRYPTDTNVTGTGNLASATQTWGDFFLALGKVRRDVTATMKWLLVPLQSVDYATQAILPNTPTYANGTAGVGATITAGGNSTLTVDGVVQALGARILVKTQVNSANNMGYNANGVYELTTVGSGAAAWVLTRAREADTSAATEMCPGTFVTVLSGTSAGLSFIMDNASYTTMATTVGATNNITFNEFTQESQLPTAKGNFVNREIRFTQAQYQRKIYDLTGKAMSFIKELGFLASDVAVFTAASGDQVGAAGLYPSGYNRGW